ncbi:hypothetical protein L2E82_10856 [Cichorium intybus]|uniref:Uncharacterized protein n=1 Tax=Cichorium intybus TaxID=13427 RepID=A0ACB9GBK6_CICIN|nr:hypothetical protein L2E82_10856 [Cichorium intybus]
MMRINDRDSMEMLLTPPSGTSDLRLVKKLVCSQKLYKRWRVEVDLISKEKEEYSNLLHKIDELELEAKARALMSPEIALRQSL